MGSLKEMTFNQGDIVRLKKIKENTHLSKYWDEDLVVIDEFDDLDLVLVKVQGMEDSWGKYWYKWGLEKKLDYNPAWEI